MRKEATYKNWFIAFIICLAVVLTGNIVFAASTVLSWTAPTTNADDTPLTDLGGFNIYYGTAPGSYSQTIDAGNVTTYQVDNLSTGVTYYFATTAYDTSGNESGYSNETSKTIPVPDTTPPVISSVQSSDITYSSASIAWTTDEASDTQIQYGTTTSYGSSTTLNSSLLTSHSQNLTDLLSSTLYHYKVLSRDAAGNLAVSGDYTFTTMAPPDTTPPVISSVQSGDITYSSASIAWTTDEASDTQIQYGTTTSYGSTTTLNSSMVTSHGQNLTNLSASTLYHYKVLSRDAAGNLAVSGDYTFTTPAPPDIMPPATPVSLRAD